MKRTPANNELKATAEEQDQLCGTLIDGDFLVRRLFAQGSESRVYLARQKSVGDRDVVVKVIDPVVWRLLKQPGKDPENPYLREARLTAILTHSSLAQIFRTGELDDGRPYLAMEYVKGLTIGAFVRKHGNLDIPQAASLVHQLTDALDCLHKNDVLFRDLKPEHVLLEPWTLAPFRVRLLDLGHAQVTYQSDSPTRHGHAEPLGTPGYMSPEAAEGRAHDERSDVFSLAALVYEALAGQPALNIPNRHPEALIEYVLSDGPLPTTPLSELRPQLPSQLDAVIARAMERNPRKRPDTALDFCNEFLAALDLGAPRVRPRRGLLARIRNRLARRKTKSARRPLAE